VELDSIAWAGGIFWYNAPPMATTTLAPSAAAARSVGGGVNLFSGRYLRADLLALLALLVAALAGLSIGYLRAPAIEIGVDGRYNRPYLEDFHEPETAAGQSAPSYRWTEERSQVRAPALGRGRWQVGLTLSSPTATGAPKLALIETDSQQLPIQLRPDQRTYYLLTPTSGDLTVAISSATTQVGNDPRALGVVFAGAEFQPLTISALPPLSFLLLTLLALALAFVTLRLIGLHPWLALIGPLIGLALLSWAVAVNRQPLGLLLPRLALLALFSLLLTLLLGWCWRLLVRLGRLEPEPSLLPALLAIFYAGFWIKAAGLLYPYSHVIDVGWHVRDIQSVLAWRVSEFYLPSAFSYGKMPVSEWGANPPLLPYTPFFHLMAAPLAIFPWPLDLSVNVFSVFFDTNRVTLIAALALSLGLTSRGALLAALLYAVTPFTFLLHSWGNMPTTLGIWWTLLATTMLVLTFGRWHERRIFWLLTAVLLASFLFYFVMAVFMMVFVLLVALGLRLFRGDLPRQARPLLGATGLAFALSIVLYYGLFIPEMIERTLPYVLRTVVGGQTNEGQAAQQTLAQYLGFYWPHLGYYLPFYINTADTVRYGLWLPLLLGLPGLWLLRKRRLTLIIVGAWYVVAVLFLFAGLRISMVDKHVFFVAPALALCSAAIFERLWTRNLLLRGALIGVYALTFVSAIELWIVRLQRVGIG
jgi:hypothetical protein